MVSQDENGRRDKIKQGIPRNNIRGETLKETEEGVLLQANLLAVSLANPQWESFEGSIWLNTVEQKVKEALRGSSDNLCGLSSYCIHYYKNADLLEDEDMAGSLWKNV